MKSAPLILAIATFWTMFVVLLVLKCTSVPALSWWLVLAPIYGYHLAVCIIVAGVVAIGSITLLGKHLTRRR